MACESKCATNCFQDWISCGLYNSVITVYTGLDAGNYTANLTDKFDHKYQLSVTVEGAGIFEINLNDLPEGLFNEFGGVINLSISKDGCDDLKIPILQGYDYIDVDCIDISVKGGTAGKMTIGCNLLLLGPELIVNGGFTGDSAGWSLGTGWTYGSDKVSYSSLLRAQALTQGGTLTVGKTYRISFNVTGTSGHVVVNFGNDPVAVYAAGSGDVSLNAEWSSSSALIAFLPWSQFDGSIDNVSVKEIL